MKLYSQNYNNILYDIKNFYTETDNLLKADAFLTWNDVVNPQLKIIELCKEHNKPSIVIEHGMKAVSDYQIDLVDILNGMGRRKLLADYIFVWGNKSKNILLKADVPEKKIYVIGSPILWEHQYFYENNGQEIGVSFFSGDIIQDPETKLNWKFKTSRHYIPQYKSGNIISFFPHHDFTHIGKSLNKMIWDKIKHLPNIFVKLSGSYLNHDNDNPFLELLKIEDDKIRREKCIAIPTSKPHNLFFIRRLLERSKIVITAIPGTINGICWAMDVPVIVPKIDQGWRDLSGNIVFDIHEADYECELNNLESKIEEISKNDTKKHQREIFAKEFMGIDLGNPTTNILKYLNKIISV